MISREEAHVLAATQRVAALHARAEAFSSLLAALQEFHGPRQTTPESGSIQGEIAGTETE
jgi:hypothetical protein